MRERLILGLHAYILENNPDLLVNLQAERRVTNYLYEKIATVTELAEELAAEGYNPGIIEEQCMAILIGDLLPSRYHYVLGILEEEFRDACETRRTSGTLMYEVINMVEACSPLLDELGFSPMNEDDRLIRYAATGAIKEYLYKQ